MSSIGNMLNKRYRLDKQIGEGGFAQVFLATDLELGRQVAVKVMEQNWVKDQDLRTRFRNEARAVAALDHPNILLIYDFGVDRGVPYIVMPYMSGGTFAARMKQGSFTLDEIGFYLDQVGSALDYAHQHGIVHRDIKPTNLLIRSDGQLVLMDFGLAKLLSNAAHAEQTAILGTVAYMAPEQFEGMVSAASDIYALGVIFYQILTGKIPFEGNTNQVLLGHIHVTPTSLLNQSSPTLASIPPSVVQALDKVIIKVLAKSPADRYSTCHTLCHAYYTAINADPKRAARTNNGTNKNQARPTFDGTLVDKHLIVPSPPKIQTVGEVVSVKKTPPVQDVHPDATVIAPSSSQPKKVLLKPARLIVTTEPDKGFRTIFDLIGETLTLGRAKDNNLYLPFPIVSRYHAVLSRLNNELQEPSYKIVQRQSINPLCFQGKEVVEKVLENGDTFEIGKRGYAECVVKLTYQAPEYGFE